MKNIGEFMDGCREIVIEAMNLVDIYIQYQLIDAIVTTRILIERAVSVQEIVKGYVRERAQYIYSRGFFEEIQSDSKKEYNIDELVFNIEKIHNQHKRSVREALHDSQTIINHYTDNQPYLSELCRKYYNLINDVIVYLRLDE